MIRDYLVQRVEHGVVRSRADVVATLEDAGLEVPRQGRDYVTARDPESGKRWRLKGALYEYDFNPERVDVPAPPPAEAAQREIEETAANELQRLGGNLSAVVDDALRTIEADTGAAVGRLSALLRGWLRPLVIGLIFSLGIIGGSWAGTLAVDDHRAADRGAGGAPRGNRRGPRDAGPDRGDDLGAGADGVAPDPRAGLLEDGGRGGAGRAPRQREAAARSQPRGGGRAGS